LRAEHSNVVFRDIPGPVLSVFQDFTGPVMSSFEDCLSRYRLNKLADTAILDFFIAPVVLFVRYLVMLEFGKLQKLRQLQNLDTQAAEIMKSFWLGTHQPRRTNVIEVNYRAKITNKTANFKVQNRSLYAS